MRITRRQLRRLIAEAYRTEAPFRSPLEQSDAFIARRYPQFTDKITSVDPRQKEAFKSALDPNRPETDIYYRAINDCINGLCQHQINDLVAEFFSYYPEYSTHKSSIKHAAKEIFDYLVEGPGVGLELLYDEDGNPRNQEDIEEVIRRYEVALNVYI